MNVEITLIVLEQAVDGISVAREELIVLMSTLAVRLRERPYCNVPAWRLKPELAAHC